jgi:putative hydrolase of the HAD superfamily
VVRAVLFDWGNTLAAWSFDPRMLEQGHSAGIDALGAEPPVVRQAFTEAYVESLLPALLAERDDEVDYVDAVGDLLLGLGCDLDAAAIWRFVAAEHAVWEGSHRLAADALDVLDALHRRGLLVGLVSNLFDPPPLARARLAALGVLERLDAVALSAEVGVRKPNAAIFEAALGALGVDATEAVFVGDRVREDVGGAGALGMRTILATWFAVDGSSGPAPDARAGSPQDVLLYVDKWQEVLNRT